MTAPRHSRPSPRKRLRKIASSLATLSLVGAGITVAATSAAAAEIPEDFQTCSLLGTDTPPTGVGAVERTEYNGFTSYTGGDIHAGAGVSEFEGLTVTAGDFYLKDADDILNIGSAIGSEIRPADGKDALLIGGEVIRSGEQRFEIAGDVYTARIGGTSDDAFSAGMYDAANVTENVGQHSALTTENYSPTYDFSTHGPKVDELSTALPSEGVEGTVSVSDSILTLDAEGLGAPDEPVNFWLSASDLESIMQIDVVNISSTQPVVINVDGDSPSIGSPVFNVSYTDVDGDFLPTNSTFPWRIDTFQGLGYAANFLWNFGSETDVSIDGNSQFVGTILAPYADVHADTSLNGQVMTNKDFYFGDGGKGSGYELHSFPWTGCVTSTSDNGSGTFQISKEISGVDSDLFDADDEFEVTYTVDGEEAGDSLIITADGAIVDGPEFDEGTEVVFDEVTPEDVNGAIFKDFTIEIDGQETDTLVVEEDANHEIVVTNRYVPTGGFTLHKRVDAEVDIPEGTEFTFDVTIGDDTELVTLIDSESQTFRGIELGTEITIAENSPDLDGFSWAGVEFQAPSITDPQVDGNTLSFILAGEGSDHTINAINSFTADEPATGSFALQKEVDAGGDFPDDTTFDFDVTIGDDDPEAISLSAGEFSDSFTDIDEGTEVTIAETTPSVDGYDWNSVTFSGGSGIQEGNSYTFTVDANDELTIIATNSFTEQEELTGSFNIHKELEGEGAELIDPETRFDVAYATSDGDDGTLTILANGNSVDGPELPEGTEVTFTEVTPDDIDGVVFEGSSIAIDGDETDTLTIGDATTAEVILTNTYSVEEVPTGGFTLEKAVEADGDFPENVDFDFDVTIGDDTESVTLGADETQDFIDIAFGTEVTISEDETTVDNYEWEGVTFSEGDNGDNTATFILDEATMGITVTATNTYSAVEQTTGTFNIHKVVEGEGADLVGPDTEFTVDYTVNGDDADESLIIIADGTVVEGPKLNSGDEVVFDEAAPADVDGAEFENSAITIDGQETSTLTIGEDTDAEVIVINTYSTTDEDPNGAENGEDHPKDDEKEAPKSVEDDDGGFLPRTGSEIATYGLAALLMLGAGTAIITGIRRKNHG